MRTLWLLSLAVFLGCTPQTSAEYVSWQLGEMRYFKDPRTGYCFVQWGSNYHGSVSYVPCEGIPDSLLYQVP